MEPKIIGKRIKDLMSIEGINENILANNLNLTRSRLEKKLNGEDEFYISEIMKIKEIFNLNLETFEKLFFEKEFKLEDAMIN